MEMWRGGGGGGGEGEGGGGGGGEGGGGGHESRGHKGIFAFPSSLKENHNINASAART
jgi:hypothetical protein